jgi:hypothetical protein
MDISQDTKFSQAVGQIFRNGYIPLIGWTCGFLILAYYLPQIMIITYVWGKNCIASGLVSQFPMKPDDLMNLVYLLITSGVYSIAKK